MNFTVTEIHIMLFYLQTLSVNEPLEKTKIQIQEKILTTQNLPSDEAKE